MSHVHCLMTKVLLTISNFAHKKCITGQNKCFQLLTKHFFKRLFYTRTRRHTTFVWRCLSWVFSPNFIRQLHYSLCETHLYKKFQNEQDRNKFNFKKKRICVQLNARTCFISKLRNWKGYTCAKGCQKRLILLIILMKKCLL